MSTAENLGRTAFSAENVASGTVWLTGMQASNYVIGLLFYFFIARLLSKEEVGLLSILMAIISIYNITTMLALNNAAIKFISEFAGKGDLEKASSISAGILRILLLVNTASLSASIAFSGYIASITHLDVQSVIMALLTAFLLDLTSYYGGVMFGLGMFKHVSAQNIIFYWVSRLSSILLCLPIRVQGIAAGFLLGAFICLLFSIFSVRGRLPRARGNFTWEIFEFSFPLYLNNMISLVQGWLDVLFLSAMAGSAQAGQYYLALIGSSALSILWSPLCSALFPAFSSSSEAVERKASLSIGIMTFIVLPVCLSAAAVSGTLLSIAYGEAYNRASSLLSLFCIFSVLSAYSSLYSVVLQALKETKPIFSAGAASTASYAILLPLLTPAFGPIGAALCRVILITVNFLVLQLFILRINVKVRTAQLLKILLISLLISSFLFLIENLSFPMIIKGTAELLSFLVLFLIMTRIVKPLSKEETELLARAAKKPIISKLIRKFLS
ncbi:oligosaccharide flippase family protein [Candidatus Methanodesulfokora washburnensis]|uniref:Uncharacterized protein n=1 Tax=Candidatus Methanodesulfokora washburnensis TaxID=2478471 RepID=A0A3R9QF27_9CREN|nr:oligosaccharide flippase family protein [Candidatus Methanodesulfokores washburnensis]RSN74941.1 hypothetical protein D6D85_07305 [Candidatus Methanodesulfokores washburnensis]